MRIVRLTTAQLLAASVAVAGASAFGYSTWQARNVASTQEALTKIEANIKDGWVDIKRDLHDLSQTQLGTAVRANIDPLTPLRDAVSIPTPEELRSRHQGAADGLAQVNADASAFASAASLVEALKSGDYGAAGETGLGTLLTLLEQGAKDLEEASRNILSNAKPAAGAPTAAELAGTTFTAAAAVKEFAVKYAQLVADLATQARLMAARTKSEGARNQAQRANEDQRIRAAAEAMFKALQLFSNAHDLDSATIREQALKGAACISPQAAGRVALGATIVDPQGATNVARIPCISPDFVAAVERQSALLRRGDPEAAGQVDKFGLNGSGGYIPVFSKECSEGLVAERSIQDLSANSASEPVARCAVAPLDQSVSPSPGGDRANAVEIGATDGSIIYFPIDKYNPQRPTITVRFLHQDADHPSPYGDWFAVRDGQTIQVSSMGGGNGLKNVHMSDGTEELDLTVGEHREDLNGNTSFMGYPPLQPGEYTIYICPKDSREALRFPPITRENRGNIAQHLGYCTPEGQNGARDHPREIKPARRFVVTIQLPAKGHALITLLNFGGQLKTGEPGAR